MIFILLLFIHMKMKKTLLGAFLWIFTLAGIAILPNYTEWQRANLWNYTNYGNTNNNNNNTNTEWDNPTWGDMITGKSQLWSQLLTSIKSTITWILRILATVAVVICLYAGFIMMTSAGDENKYKNGMKILKYAAIWLAIILLSWLIVSAIFWFVNLNWWSGNTMEAQW